MSEFVLQCDNVWKSYKRGSPVLMGFHWQVQPGKIVGLLGPNGCGKSTLIKLISGILVPDMGQIYVDGKARSEESNALISYLPERTYINNWMKVNDLINYFLDFYADFDAKLARKMLLELDIDPNATLKTLSKGTKEKVQLVMVMARRAKLYLLDEPIAGVDPAAREYILNTILTNYNPEGTVIISTHLISDVEKVLDEVVFLKDGRIVCHDTVDHIRETQGKSVDALFREIFRTIPYGQQEGGSQRWAD